MTENNGTGTGTGTMVSDLEKELENSATVPLMTSSKPKLHQRGVMDGTQGFEDEPDPLDEFQRSKWYLASNTIFLISSALYLAMAAMLVESYWFYKDVPLRVFTADDDATWWNYYVNCTDDIPQNVTIADDDNTWYEWYNTSAYYDDDSYFWQPKIANANLPGYESYVSRYMILYFFAALGFVITGVIELLQDRKCTIGTRVIYYLMILAALCGWISAILTNRNAFWSNFFNLLSCTLWALDGITIVGQRFRGISEADDYEDGVRFCCMSIKAWFWIADISFLLGTLGDAITSWIYIFDVDGFEMQITQVFDASMWLLCAIIYMGMSIYDHNQYIIYFEGDEYQNDLQLKELPPSGVVTVDHANGGGGGDKNLKTQHTTSSAPSSNNDSGDEKKPLNDFDEA